MDRIQSQKHNIGTFYYGLSIMLERASHYGLRSLIVLYMTGEVLKMNNSKAFGIYGLVMGSLVFFQIFGALLGDLLIGNRRSIIIGGIIQVIGAFCLGVPSTIGFYIGIFLIVLGSGFFTPNIISNFGKLYLNKERILDSGFTIFYLMVNLGSFLGVLLIGYLGEKFGYNIGFIISGILMSFSIIPVIVSKELISKKIERNELSINKKVLCIGIIFIAIGIFWSIYEIVNIRFFDVQLKLSQISSLDIPKSFWNSFNTIFIVPISLIAIILWRYFYSSQFFKLMLGFIFAVISFVILLLIPEAPTEQHTLMYFISLFFFGISEIHIAPMLYSILTKYANPKYLAILISLAFLPTRVISLVFGLFNNIFYDNPTLGLKFGIITMVIVSVGFIGYCIIKKKIMRLL